MDGIRGYRGWRWIFILEGVITVAIGLFAPLFLIDFPDKARFLKPDEKEHVLNRLNIERGDGETHSLSWKLLRQHLSDWTLWWISLVYLCNVGPIYSLAYFVPTILNVYLIFTLSNSSHSDTLHLSRSFSVHLLISQLSVCYGVAHISQTDSIDVAGLSSSKLVCVSPVLLSSFLVPLHKCDSSELSLLSWVLNAILQLSSHFNKTT
jgi:hypothetical protein